MTAFRRIFSRPQPRRCCTRTDEHTCPWSEPWPEDMRHGPLWTPDESRRISTTPNPNNQQKALVK